MSKTINWNKTYTDPIRRKNIAGESVSIKDRLSKAYEQERRQKVSKDELQKMMPAMEQLLMIRIKNKTPLKVLRPIQYQTSELQKSEFNGEMMNGKYIDVTKVIKPGQTLLFELHDKTMQQLIFKSEQTNEEIPLSYSDARQLMMQTDIYETIYNLLNKEGDK